MHWSVSILLYSIPSQQSWLGTPFPSVVVPLSFSRQEVNVFTHQCSLFCCRGPEPCQPSQGLSIPGTDIEMDKGQPLPRSCFYTSSTSGGQESQVSHSLIRLFRFTLEKRSVIWYTFPRTLLVCTKQAKFWWYEPLWWLFFLFPFWDMVSLYSLSRLALDLRILYLGLRILGLLLCPPNSGDFFKIRII